MEAQCFLLAFYLSRSKHSRADLRLRDAQCHNIIPKKVKTKVNFAIRELRSSMSHMCSLSLTFMLPVV